ncbi:prophage Lp1 protein [Oceanobacillus picturae]|uniref:Prophage Lp1 protein n=1 Tax=Oceanobacillus picturae TaxID=171693 RepID=A0A0U9H5T4_9BACI|nr:YopX family protein [Oceanobacillus picturae]GAQ18002.1 prophage Lp1 protein [Oceanobacillus picturae]
MDREIKFRAWDKVNEKMLNYGTDEACEVWEDGCDYMGMSFITHQPNIIWMQYTGLEDDHGKEVFEGDILEFEDIGEEGYEYKDGYDFINRATIVFEEGRFVLSNFLDINSAVIEEVRDENHDHLVNIIDSSRIIGNIYEDSHLLEGDSHV